MSSGLLTARKLGAIRATGVAALAGRRARAPIKGKVEGKVQSILHPLNHLSWCKATPSQRKGNIFHLAQMCHFALDEVS